MIVVGTIPAGILGLALEHKLRDLFASPTSAAIFLIDQRHPAAGLRALAAPPAAARRLRRATPTRRISKMSFKQALAIGTAQAAALVPGISRSGITMGGGLLDRPLQRGRRPLLLPAGDADHRRRRAAEAARPARLGRRRGARPGAGRRDRRGDHHLLRGQVPAPLLRDQPPHPVRRLLHRRRPHLHADLRLLSRGGSGGGSHWPIRLSGATRIWSGSWRRCSRSSASSRPPSSASGRCGATRRSTRRPPPTPRPGGWRRRRSCSTGTPSRARASTTPTRPSTSGSPTGA